jgi:hypothetical protein
MSAPEYWHLLCYSMFQTGRELAAQLWDHLPQADAVAWQLKIMEARGKDYRVALNRTRRLAAILSPQMLFQASLALEPEGRPRSQAIRQFEEAVMRLTNREGAWRW